MKIPDLLALSAALSSVSAAAMAPTATQDATITGTPKLEKRYQKVRLGTTTTSSSSEQPKPWIRTISSTIVEIVTPTVIQGVTFSGKPSTETGGYPQPWISLNKYGSPKTINPKVKNQKTQNASPNYSTYFQTAVTHTYGFEELKAHNMAADQVHEEVEYIEEDKTYVELNPLIRCTPERYSKQGLARDTTTEPFCSPSSGVELAMDKTYFITWFTRYFSDEVKKVRLHFTYVKESAKQKGMKKREIDSAFFTTEWIDNVQGYYPFDVESEWLQGSPIKAVAMTIQPDTISDEEFDLMTNATFFKLASGNKVVKKTKAEKAMEDEGIDDDTWYYVALSIPSVIALTGLGMYVFLQITSGDRDFSATRSKAWKKQHKVWGKFKPNKSNKKYSELPTIDDKNFKLA